MMSSKVHKRNPDEELSNGEQTTQIVQIQVPMMFECGVLCSQVSRIHGIVFSRVSKWVQKNRKTKK